MTDENENKIIEPSMEQLPKCNMKHLYYIIKIFISELLGTATLCFVAVLYTFHSSNSLPEPVIVFFMFAWIVWIFGPISAAQINPAVTLALFLTRRLSIIYGLLCISAQLVGSILGSLTAIALLPSKYAQIPNIGLVMRDPDVSIGNTILFELFAGFAIVITILSSTDEFRPNLWTIGMHSTLPFELGCIHALLVAVIGNYSGAGLNPARCFGTAVINNNYQDLWIYFVGPSIGAIIASVLYELVLSFGNSLGRIKACFTNPKFDRTTDYRD